MVVCPPTDPAPHPVVWRMVICGCHWRLGYRCNAPRPLGAQTVRLWEERVQMSPRFARVGPLLLTVLMAAIGPFRVATAYAEATDVSEFSWIIGSGPLYCANVPGRQICTWDERRTQHVVCDFDEAGIRTGRSCLITSDNRVMQTFPNRTAHRRKARTANRDLRNAAQAKLGTLRTLDDVIELVGAGPAWCGVGEKITCGWKLARRTPGYILFARVANAPGKKLEVWCRFDRSGGVLSDGCHVKLKGSFTPPPT